MVCESRVFLDLGLLRYFDVSTDEGILYIKAKVTHYKHFGEYVAFAKKNNIAQLSQQAFGEILFLSFFSKKKKRQQIEFPLLKGHKGEKMNSQSRLFVAKERS